MSEEDVIYETAMEVKYPEKVVKHVVKHFWKSIRYYISRPLEAKGGILIENFGKFYLSMYRITKHKTHAYLTNNKERYEFFDQLINNKLKYEKQTNKTKDNG